MRRFAMLVVSLSLVVGSLPAGRLVAQDDKKDTSKTEAKDTAAPTTPDQKPAETPAVTATPAPEPPAPKPIPPEVEAKLEAARRAVAEAIVAAQDAGLVDTTIDPPPILDILIDGRATDKATLKAKLEELKATPDVSPEAGLSLEAFGAWYTGYGQLEGVAVEKNVRIMPPSKGLKAFFDNRAAILNRHIAEVRKAQGPAAAQPAATPAPTDETKPEEVKPAEPKPEEAKPAEVKAEETKPEAPKPEEKPEETKSNEAEK